MAVCIQLSDSEQELLRKIHRRHHTPEFLKERIQIILAASQGLKNRAIAAAGWIFVCDNLNTHVSVMLVMLVAMLCDIPLWGLGKPGKSGILKSQATRKAFLEDTSHRIRFV